MTDRPRLRRRTPTYLALILTAAAAASAMAQEPSAPRPQDVFGFDPVADARLVTWNEILDYFEILAEASPRVKLDTIGRSTLDRPMIAVIISSESNLSRLNEFREIQAKLADPRRISNRKERDLLVSEGRLVALVTAGIHPTEVGGPLAAMELAHRLATSPGPVETKIRQEAIVLLVPSMNPDGIDPVKAWHEETEMSPWVGADPPFLYHHYAGHDVNRDWYAFTQKETRAVVQRLHQVWHPQLDHDIHQQEASGARFFVPPWKDPVEPNVDPLLTAAATSLGTRVQWSMLDEGRTGISVAARYDAWSPARAFVHYHAGVRFLSETASARLASPIELTPDQLIPIPGLDPRVSSWNHPIPWPGGRWTLADIVSYMESGAIATLSIASGEREAWLRNFERVGRRAVAGWPSWPQAWIVPPGTHTGAADAVSPGVAELVRILRTAGVEVRRTLEGFRSRGIVYPPGTYLVDMHQPYAAFVQAVLAPQEYPARNEYPEGPPEAPYDVTAHNLPLLLGVRAVPVNVAPAVSADLVTEDPIRPPRFVEGVSNSPAVMVGLYRPWTASMDEGWTRWLFDNYSIPYTSITNDDIGRGDLAMEFTTIVLPSIDGVDLREGRSLADVPPEFAGGLGESHIGHLRRFVEEGGTLVAMGGSVGFTIEALQLPVEDFLVGLSRSDFYAPGALVGLSVDTALALGSGMPASTAAWVEGGSAFRALADAPMTVVARYASRPVLRSGWVVGESWIAGRPALVQVRLGRGSVILFGFRPQYRGQSLVTYPLLFNALKRSH
ncbi:MAG: M14 family zinc carboxypeptidase [Gemmatimonadota bacterium]|nr:M14 family zinc carboxypeptidase [Gemmatimonadota bacterium]